MSDASISRQCAAISRTTVSTGAGTQGGREGGAWGYCAHLRQYGLNFDFGLASCLLALAPTSSLEFGCGLGLYTSWLHRMGGVAPAIGVEPNAMPSSIFRPDATWPQQLVANLLNTSDAASQACIGTLGTFDLVFSIEVAEHIPRSLHGALADLLVAHTRGFLVFSAGRTGQSGRGHISNRAKSEWAHEFTSRGMVALPLTTRRFMGASRNVEIRQNVAVFAAAGAPLGKALDGVDGGAVSWGQLATRAPSTLQDYVRAECRQEVPMHIEHRNRDPCLATHGANHSLVEHHLKRAGVPLSTTRMYTVSLPGDVDDGSSGRSAGGGISGSGAHGRGDGGGGGEADVIWYPPARLRRGEVDLWPGLIRQAAAECWGYFTIADSGV